ncbi:MAG: FHA domain-containing protein [Planctomycetes bacterium]|nr:FHA domain-containing protein [Planctomycetota bacterium]
MSGKRKGAEIELPGEGEVVDIGNRDSAKLAIHDPWISFNHAQIKRVNGRYLIEDQGSSNGTWVLKGANAERVERHELASEDVFALGNTRVRFLGSAEAPAPAPAADDPAPPAAEKPWWDKVIDEGAGQEDGQRVRLLKRELAEEKRMRQALEKFLDLPAGATVGDSAKAGELEQRVRELETQLEQAKEGAKSGVLPADDMLTKHTQRLRRGHMSEVVSLEGRATTAEAKVADLENRLRERTESAKKERAEQRTEIERLQHELDELKASGGDPGATVDARLGELTAELTEVRKTLGESEAKRAELETQLREARTETVDRSDVEGIKAELKAALEQVAHYKGEQARLIQELDDVSMEQIEIEETLQARIRALEGQLRDVGIDPVVPEDDAPVGRAKRASERRQALEDDDADDASDEADADDEGDASDEGAQPDASDSDDASDEGELSTSSRADLHDDDEDEDDDLLRSTADEDASDEGELVTTSQVDLDDDDDLLGSGYSPTDDGPLAFADESFARDASSESFELADDAPSLADSGELEFDPMADDDDERGA